LTPKFQDEPQLAKKGGKKSKKKKRKEEDDEDLDAVLAELELVSLNLGSKMENLEIY
jgi:hypothetical protein